MHAICLKDNWTLTVLGKNVYDIPETPIETKVPSTVYGTLLEKGLIQKLVEIKALLHELSGNFHRTPARAGILKHAGIMGNSHIKCFCCTDGKLRVIQQKIDKF